MDFEGTILTEGVGVGRGTRFATPESNVRLNTGGRQRGIEGGKGGISPGAALNIDPGLATVRARPLEPLQTKPIITDGSGVSARAISNVGEILSRAAFEYADRQAEAKATDAVLDFNERNRQIFFGNPDDPESTGMSGLKGQAAVDARGSFFEAVDKDYADTIASLPPAVKQKAMSRLSSIRDTTLNRAANHIGEQQHFADVQQKGRAINDAVRELEVDPNNYENIKLGFFRQFGMDEINAGKAWDSIVIEGGDSKYLASYNRSKLEYEAAVKADPQGDHTPPSGLQALKEFRERLAPTVSQKALNDIDKLIRSYESIETSGLAGIRESKKRAEKAWLDDTVFGAMEYISKNPDAVHSVSDLRGFGAGQGILTARDPDALKYILSFAEGTRAKGTKAEKPARHADFNLTMMDLSNEGKVFTNPFAFAAFANEHGIYDAGTIKSAYTDQHKVLEGDEKTLKGQFTEIIKSAGIAFKAPYMPPAPEGTGDATKDAMADLSWLRKSKTASAKPEPEGFRKFKEDTYSIYSDKSILPVERSKKLTEYVENAAKEYGALKDANSMQIVGTIFRAQASVDNLLMGERKRGSTMPSLTSNQVSGDPIYHTVDGVSLPSSQIIEPEVAPPSKEQFEYHKTVFGDASSASIDMFQQRFDQKQQELVKSGAIKEPLLDLTFVRGVNPIIFPSSKNAVIEDSKPYTGYIAFDSNGAAYPVLLKPKAKK